MLKSEDFQLGLEQELRLRVIKDEIDECTDQEALKQNLKNCTELIMKYQHLLAAMLREKLSESLKDIM